MFLHPNCLGQLTTQSNELFKPDLRERTIQFDVDLGMHNSEVSLSLLQMTSEQYCDAFSVLKCQQFTLMRANFWHFQSELHTCANDECNQQRECPAGFPLDLQTVSEEAV